MKIRACVSRVVPSGQTVQGNSPFS